MVRAAKKANPDSIAEIDAKAAELTAEIAAKETAKADDTTDQSFFEGWTGKGEFGGSMSTGNSEDKGFVVSLGLDKQTRDWGHDLNISVDHKREDEKTTKDRYFAAYSVNWNLSPKLYSVGVLWGERDRFAGVNFRFSESLGLGYHLVKNPKFKLRIEGGPALRQSEYLTRGYETTIAARGAEYLTWQATPGLQFTQSLVTYLDSKNSTLLGSAALTTKLQEKISARASYEVRFEQDPPDDRARTDTTTRVTLVFDF